MSDCLIVFGGHREVCVCLKCMTFPKKMVEVQKSLF